MNTRDCPGWDYADHPNANAVGARCAQLLIDLRTGAIATDQNVRDTRPLHSRMFTGLTPSGHPYFAGHYRGEKFRCLEFYNVMIQSDPRVGVDARHVARDMANLADHILRPGFSALQAAFALPDSRISPAQKLYFLVVFCCRTLVEFLRIHPYANGNGHMGRLIVWLTLAKFGYWPQTWPLDTSPPYHDLISKYRDNDVSPLEQFLLCSILGRPYP